MLSALVANQDRGGLEVVTLDKMTGSRRLKVKS